MLTRESRTLDFLISKITTIIMTAVEQWLSKGFSVALGH